MTLATLPSLYMWMNRYSVESYLGSWMALVFILGLFLLALCFGLGPAFFPRVDHPLHCLDRVRWVSCSLCFIVFMLFSLCSDGAVHVARLQGERSLTMSLLISLYL